MSAASASIEGTNANVVDDKKKKMKSLFKRQPGDLDFNELVKEHGFVKARQILKQSAIQSHQAKVATVEENVRLSHQSERLKEAVRLSSTLGTPSSSSAIDKIIDITNQNRQQNVYAREHLSEKEIRAWDADNALKRTMMNEEGSLLIAQGGLYDLPPQLGSTLFMQTAFVRTISLPRNHLSSIFNLETSQLASMHFRYVTSINLADNKITYLPADIGHMKLLETMELSDNYLSKLPLSMTSLASLSTLNLRRNKFSDLDVKFGLMTALTSLNLAGNQFTKIPFAIGKLLKLTHLDFSDNMLPHLGIMPAILGPENLWTHQLDMKSGKKVFINILTKEKYRNISRYDYKLIEAEADLHVFQPPESVIAYRRRRTWLSICNVAEWESVLDVRSGWTYFKNNVSGGTQWNMPKDIDLLGNLRQLETLVINDNNVRSLPESITKLTKLAKISILRNKLMELPPNINALTSLEYLYIDNNDLKILPSTICQCKRLREILCQNNQLVRLPDLIGTLPKLEILDVSVNQLKRLSYSLGQCKSLREFRVFENPLIDPPESEIPKGLESIQWYLRNQLMIEKRGMPPVMIFHSIGINDEVNYIRPDYLAHIQLLADAAKTSHVLNLQYLGLTELPPQVGLLPQLKRLQLDYNPNIRLNNGFPSDLTNLQVLSIKSSKINSLPESIQNLKKLKILQCDINLMEVFPTAVFKLRALSTLGRSSIPALSIL